MQRSTFLRPLSLAVLLSGCDSSHLFPGDGALPSESSDSYGYSTSDTGYFEDADSEDDQTADTAEITPECEDAEAKTLYLSPDDSNSMSSPVQARSAALAGDSLGLVRFRTWEFFNYYTFDYPRPDLSEDLDLQASMVPSETVEGEFILQIAAISPKPETRAPMNITLVLDTSGSMSGEPIARLKDACAAIAGALQEGDVISIVTWSSEQDAILSGHVVSGPDDEVLTAAISAIASGGGTDLSGGLEAGYALAEIYRAADRINRVVLISDGGANMGVTDEELIGRYAGSQNEDGIYMVGVGVGEADDYNDLLMDQVTDAGKGASLFIPTTAEAELILGERFGSTMDVWARDVGVQLDLPQGFEIVTFSGEEYSTEQSEIEPQHLAPDDTMVFHQTIRHCDPDTLTGEEQLSITLTWQDAVTFEPSSRSLSLSMNELTAQDPALLLKGAAIYAYAEGMEDYAYGTDEEAAAIDAILARAEDHNPGDADLAEIRAVLGALR